MNAEDILKHWGDYEESLYGESLDAIHHFVEHNPPEEWDYYDI